MTKDDLKLENSILTTNLKRILEQASRKNRGSGLKKYLENDLEIIESFANNALVLIEQKIYKKYE